MLAQKIKQCRDKYGMTNKELAEKSGVPLSTINRFLAKQDSDSISLQNLCALAKAVNCSLDKALGISVSEPEKASAITKEEAEKLLRRFRLWRIGSIGAIVALLMIILTLVVLIT